ncbi:hypothetical protein [Stenotrophomonas sp. ZAC14A_NAIMI4_1]|uniref:hypothetical protein n=1 Tax=Stenotrophomonas sp. ZAC14A_NAIMI4_1 TaxID=2072412 RepID=UPI00131EE18C|nr:hypothetical protein [Stenotrophomonas sp. ZAC14A_NAIMI4_1]
MLIANVSGGGKTWLSNSHFTLSADGDALTAIDRTNNEFIRFRCPARQAEKAVRE